MEINFAVQPVGRPGVAQAGQVDVSSGISNLARGVDNFSTGLQTYLTSAKEEESDLAALTLANEAQVELDQRFHQLEQDVLDPKVLALKKTQALQAVRDKFYLRAHQRGVDKTFGNLATKHMFNVQANILKEAHETEGVYAQAKLVEDSDAFGGVIQQHVQAGFVEKDLQTGHLQLNLGMDAFRDISARSEGLRMTIQRALQSTPPEKVLETLNSVNRGLEDSYAKSLIASDPDGAVTSSFMSQQVVVPKFTLVNGRVVMTPHTLTQEEKGDVHQRAIAFTTGLQSQLEHERKVADEVKEEIYHQTLATVQRQYGAAGKDLDIQSLRHMANSMAGGMTNKRRADLEKELNTVDAAVKASQDGFTDQRVMMGLLFRIESKEEVPYGEILQQSISGNLNRGDLQFLLAQKGHFDTQTKSEFDTQFNQTIDSIESLFVATDAKTILGDKISEYQFFIRQKALEIRGHLPVEELVDPANANRIVLEAASQVLPAIMATQLDSSSGVDKSRFGKFFQVLAGGDVQTARHILAVTPNMSVTQRANLQLGVAGMESIMGLQQQVQSGEKTSFGLQRKPHEQISINQPVPLAPEVRTKVPGAQNKVNELEAMRLNMIEMGQQLRDDRRKRLDEIEKFQQEKTRGSE